MEYLEFGELDDYLQHIEEESLVLAQQKMTYIEITSTLGEPDQHGVCSITYFATLTRRFESHIAVHAIPLLRTANFHLQVNQDRDHLRTKLHSNFEQVCALLSSRGIQTRHGLWQTQVPSVAEFCLRTSALLPKEN
jgi:hypothetical protein